MKIQNNFGQTQKMSLLESMVSVVSGYLLTAIIQFHLFPVFGIHVPLTDTLLISLIIVLIAFVKNFSVRRLFNRLDLKEKEIKLEGVDAKITR